MYISLWIEGFLEKKRDRYIETGFIPLFLSVKRVTTIFSVVKAPRNVYYIYIFIYINRICVYFYPSGRKLSEITAAGHTTNA